MAEIGCALGLRAPLDALPSWLHTDPDWIARTIADASAAQIVLRVDPRGLAHPLSGAEPSHALDLHYTAELLTGNGSAGRLGSIAVIFADTFAPHPDVFGFMFDHARTDLPEFHPAYSHIPREGCAIFLGAIAALRGAGTEAYERETEFTTIHEIGHVFNLGHRSAPVNFMASSRIDGAYDAAGFHFHPSDRAWLAQCDDNPSVCPGGSPFTGDDAAMNPRRTRRSSVPRSGRAGLRLRASVHRSRFFAPEPIELDLRLELRRDAQSMSIPDRIDPGYREFVIWIEEPGGERRRYRSPRRYCPSPARLRITPGRPYTRDVSIFFGSGGHTFRTPGEHRIWVEFEFRRGQRIRSNRVDVDVISASPRNQGTADLTRILSQPHAARVLYHRMDGNRRAGLSLLAALIERHPAAPCAATVRYAMARALLQRSLSKPLDPAERRGLVKLAADWLERARDASSLSEHQRGHCDALLDRIGQRDPVGTPPREE